MSPLRRLATTLLLVNLFVIGLAALSAYHGYRQYRERAEVTTRNLAGALESNLGNVIRRVDVSLLALLDIHSIHHAEHQRDPSVMTRHIEKIRSRLPEVDAIRFADERGMLVFGNDVDPQAHVSVADRPHFVRLRDNPDTALVISKPQISRINGKWVIVLARRMLRADGGFGGMVFAAIALDSLGRQFATLDLGAHGTVFLRDDQLGLVMHYPDMQAHGLAIGDKYASPELQALHDTGQTSGTFFTQAAPDHIARMISFRKLDGYPLYAFVGLAATDYLAPWRADSLRLAIMALLFLLGSLYAARIQYRALQRQEEAKAVIQRQEALYQELVEDTPMLVVRYLPDTTITFANAAYAEFFANTPEELQGRCWLDFIDGEEAKAAVRARIATLTPERPVSSSNQHRVLGKDGHTHWMQWTERATFDDQGVMTHIQSVGEDITERKRVRDIQAARLRLMEFSGEHPMHDLLVATLDEVSALTESQIGFYHFLDADQKTLSLQAWSTRTSREYCKAEGEGRHYNVDEAGVWVEAIRARQAVVHNDYAALPNKQGLPPGHAALLRELVVPVFRKGLIVAILGVGNKATPYTDNDVQAVSLLADLAWDFAEAKRMEAELMEMATVDFLTGLVNRRSFMARMDEELARLKRFDIPHASVLMLDLDHFKHVNDSHGHAVGDAVLKHFAALVRSELRQIDTGGRVGGEEFAILLLGADLAAAELFAERLRTKVADTPLDHDGKFIPVTVSIGIATLAADDANSDAALSRADTALYEAKRSGRNRVCRQAG